MTALEINGREAASASELKVYDGDAADNVVPAVPCSAAPVFPVFISQV